MNLCACLGVGPGHQLLLGPLTPGMSYRVVNAPLQAVDAAPRPVRGGSRNREASRALRARIEASLKRGESHTQIADREKVSRSYVAMVASNARIVKPRRTREETDAIFLKAKRLLATGMKQNVVARECGLSPPHLCMLLSRRAA